MSNPTATQSFNRYTYVNNNPLSYIDPSGFHDRDRQGGYNDAFGRNPDNRNEPGCCGSNSGGGQSSSPGSDRGDGAGGFDPGGLSLLDRFINKQIDEEGRVDWGSLAQYDDDDMRAYLGEDLFDDPERMDGPITLPNPPPAPRRQTS